MLKKVCRRAGLVLSLFVVVTASCAWVRSYWWMDVIVRRPQYNKWLLLFSECGCIGIEGVTWWLDAPINVSYDKWEWSHEPAGSMNPVPPAEIVFTVAGFSYSRGGSRGLPGASVSYWDVRLPHASLVLLGSVWPMFWLRRTICNRNRQRGGLCLGCGYDLRASGGRCPECGRPVGPARLPGR